MDMGPEGIGKERYEKYWRDGKGVEGRKAMDLGCVGE
jgi:hypothetical protein